jgi:multicomponent Na+:H+ antiporter subunit D
MSLVMLTSVMFLAMLLFEYDTNYVNKLYVFLFLVLQALINGIFLSNDLFNIFVLIEVATITISILIMFKQDKRSIYDGIVYMLVNIVAMTIFLFGIAYMYKIFGVVDLTAIKEKMSLIEDPAVVIIPYAFMITAVALKSALMPLFSWLPKAHGTPSAPSAISAILSGLYVKSGIYLFIRLQNVFFPVIDTSQFFMIMGFITGVVGFFLALSQTDIKLILAYHTVSQIGLIMLGVNYQSEYAYWGGIYHIINHSFFKSTLFLGAGLIIDKYKTRNIWEIKGVFKRMPVVGFSSLIAILGITGAPFFNGSISKYFIQKGVEGSLMESGLFLINIGTIISFIKYGGMFFGDSKQKIEKVGVIKSGVLLFLGFVCFAGGIWGPGFLEILFDKKLHIDTVAYMQKGGIYLFSLLIGYVIYKAVVLKSKIFYKVREFELDFNNICMTITLFLGLMTTYLTVRYVFL